MLCDIPFEWRKGIVQALCYTLDNIGVSCDDVKGCQTLTKLYPFSINFAVNSDVVSVVIF